MGIRRAASAILVLLAIEPEALAQSAPSGTAPQDASHIAKAHGKVASKPNKQPPKAASKQQPKKGGKKPLARKPGSDPGEPDEATRRIIAGTAQPGTKTVGRG